MQVNFSHVIKCLVGICCFFNTTLSIHAQQLKLMLPIGHTSYIKLSRISPDGKKVVTLGNDDKIIMWDLETGFRVADLLADRGLDDVLFNKGGNRILGIQRYNNNNSIPLWDYRTSSVVAQLQHNEAVKHAEFSPDGSKIVTASYDGTAKVWDASSGQLLHTLNCGAGIVTTARFSVGGNKIVTAGSVNLNVWDVRSGERLLDLNAHQELVNDVIFSPDGKKLITASDDHTAKIWDAEAGTLLFTLKMNDDVSSVVMDAAGTRLITSVFSLDNKGYQLWDMTTGKLLQTLMDTKDKPRFVKFSNDGKLVVAGSEEPDVKVWSAATGELVYTLKGHYSVALDAEFSPDDAKLYVATGSNGKVWDLKTGLLLKEIKGASMGFTDVELSRDGKRMVLTEEIAHVWNLNKMSVSATLKGYTNAVETVAFSPDQKMLVTDNRIGTFTRLWDIEKGNMYATVLYEVANTDRIIYSNSFITAVRMAKDSRTVEIWDIRKGAVNAVLDKRNSAYIINWAFTPDERKLVTADIDNAVKIWSIETGELLQVMEHPFTATIRNLVVSPDGKRLIATENDKYSAVIWDMETGKVVRRIPNMHKAFIDKAEFLPQKEWLLTISSDKTSKIWDINNGQVMLSIDGHKGNLKSYSFTPDFKRLVTSAYYDGNAKLWDVENRKLIANLSGHKDDVRLLKISPDGRYIATIADFESTVRIWDSKDGKLIHAFPAHKRSSTKIIFSADSRFLFSYGGDAEPKKWEVASAALVQTFKGIQGDYISSMVYNDATKELVAADGSGTIHLWNTESGERLNTFNGHTAWVNSLLFGINKETIISASNDNTVKTWNKKSGKVVANFFPVGSPDFMTQLPDAYYHSSPNAAKLLHYVTPDLQIVTFEQLDVKYNRPDLVLKAIGSADTALISSYRKAYEKRIKKLGIDTSAFKNSFSVPEADFVDRESIAYEQTFDLLKLHIKGVDSTYLLDRLNVWVNEVPVFGLKGISLQGNKRYVDTAISIVLSQGVNRIETSVTNINGTESYRKPLILSYAPSVPQKEKLHFIGIGIDKFQDSRQDLNYSVKDVRDLSIRLKEKYGDDISIDTLFDQQVTISNVTALKQKLLTTSVNDKVILSYSGHGLLSKDFDYYLSTYTVNFQRPEENGLPYDALESLLDGIPARQKLMLIDACHSGEVDKEEMQKYRTVVKEKAGEGLKGLDIENTDSTARVGMKNSFELMQELFVNVGRSTGATIISAAAGTQLAQERGDLKNGVFTYSILEFMKEHSSATVTELKQYVNKRVPELTRGLQVPTTRSESKVVEWKVW